MALTVEQQHDWSTSRVNTNTSTIGGAMTITGGTILNRRNGPVTAGNGPVGMSPIFKSVSGSNYQNYMWTGLTDTNGTIRIIDTIYRAKQVVSLNSTHYISLMDWDRGGAFWIYDAVAGKAKLFFQIYSQGFVDIPNAAVTPFEWTNIRLVTKKISAGFYDMEVMYRTSTATGVGSWQSLFTISNGAMGGGVTFARFGVWDFAQGGNSQQFTGRIFGTVASASSLNDRYDELPGTTWPSNKTDWYLDTVSGNDSSGDGSSSSPWQTIAKIVTEDSQTFQCPASGNRYTTLDGTPFNTTAVSQKVSGDLYQAEIIKRNGDKVILKYNSGTEIPITGSSLFLSTPGLTLAGEGIDSKTKLIGLKPVSSGSWVLDSGHVYKAALGYINCFGYQNRRNLQPVFHSVLASGIAACEALIGSQYTHTNGTIYTRPFNDINLTTAPNGTIETTTINGPGPTLVEMFGDDSGAENLEISHSTLVNSVDNTDAIGGYCFGFTGQGTKGLKDCILHDGGKHVYGDTGDKYNSDTLVINNIMNGAAGWDGVSQTVIADYASQPSYGNRTYYKNNKIPYNYSLMGTANYKTNPTTANYITHTNGATLKTITNATNSSGLIKITAVGHGYSTGYIVTIASVGGTTESNGVWTITVIDVDNFTLQGSTFVHSYTSGGTATVTNNPYSSLIMENNDFEGGGSPDIELSISEIIMRDNRFNRMTSANAAKFYNCSFKNCGNLGGTYDFCTANFEKRASDNSMAWTKLDSGSITTISNSVLNLNASGTSVWYANTHGFSIDVRKTSVTLPSGLPMIYGASYLDIISYKGVRWILGGGSGQVILAQYNDGSTTSDRTLANLQTLGIDVGGTYVNPSGTSTDSERASYFRMQQKSMFA